MKRTHFCCCVGIRSRRVRFMIIRVMDVGCESCKGGCEKSVMQPQQQQTRCIARAMHCIEPVSCCSCKTAWDIIVWAIRRKRNWPWRCICIVLRIMNAKLGPTRHRWNLRWVESVILPNTEEKSNDWRSSAIRDAFIIISTLHYLFLVSCQYLTLKYIFLLYRVLTLHSLVATLPGPLRPACIAYPHSEHSNSKRRARIHPPTKPNPSPNPILLPQKSCLSTSRCTKRQ